MGVGGVEWREECTNEVCRGCGVSGRGEPVRGLQRAVLLRAVVAALALGAAVGVHVEVGHALAKRGAERAEREAVACAEAARHPDLFDSGWRAGCR
ncbi:hypothetical protein BU198_12515 [Streptomyces sp. CBMA156]|nr:hypothetical protein [Streptomyces sp. CBMA156]